MNRRDVRSSLGFGDDSAPLEAEWDAAMETLPAGPLPFLAGDHVSEACETVGLPDDVTAAAVDAASRIAADDALRALVWYLHYRLFRSETFDMRAPPLHTSGIGNWPRADAFGAALGEARGFVYVLVVLSGLEHMAALHHARSLPADVCDRETAAVHERIRRRVASYRETHDAPGIDLNGCYWISTSLRGEIFRLGRLRFQFGQFRPADSLVNLHTFRHDRSGAVVALSADGVRYHADGQLASADDVDDDDVWEARLERAGGTVRGYPIDPTGSAVREPTELPQDEWTEAFGPDVPHLRIHIPGDGPMSFADCGASFDRALEFFPRYFPDRPFDAFVCTSWILDTQLQTLLSASSNMVRFQRELYLFPTFRYDQNDRRLARRVLGELPDDPDPDDGSTSLETAILDRLTAGHGLHSTGGGGFLLPTDLDWGSQRYRRQDPPWDDG